MAVRALLVAALGLALTACSASGDEAAVSTGASKAELQGATTGPVSAPSLVYETALLTDVRAAAHAGYDRIVFEFRNGTPGYDVRYVERPVLQDGSGARVRIDGAAVILVRMEPALDADLSQPTAPPTYTGPTRFSPTTATAVELVRVGGFEAVLTWAAGMRSKRPFRVTRLENPPRIVIDVAPARNGQS